MKNIDWLIVKNLVLNFLLLYIIYKLFGFDMAILAGITDIIVILNLSYVRYFNQKNEK